MRNVLKIGGLLGLLLLPVLRTAPSLWALDTSYGGNFLVPEQQPGYFAEQYELKVARKFERGAQNFFLSFLEIPHGVKTEIQYREREYLPVSLETFFIGMFKGFLNGLGRMGVGFYEMITFAYPQEPVLPEMDEWLI